MSFIMPATQPKTLSDFKRVDFEVLARDIHPIDQIELHKQAREMIYSTLTGKAIAAHNLQIPLNNISTQFQLEKASSQAKDTRIKSLEGLIIKLGHDPKDIKATKQLIKKKNDDIVALRKQLKIPQLQPLQTLEFLETQQKHEELMDLVLQLNDQLKETKKESDNLIQLKQTNIASTSANVIPIMSTTVPSTLKASLAPTAPPATSLPVTTESTTTSTSGEDADKLVKAMNEMSIQATEMNRLREKMASLETNYKIAQIMQKEESYKANKMNERVKALEKDQH